MTRSVADAPRLAGRGRGTLTRLFQAAGAAAAPSARSGPAVDDADPYLSARGRFPRKLVIVAILAYFLILPAAVDFSHRVTPATIFVLAGIAGFAVLVTWVAIWPAQPAAHGLQWAWLGVIVALGIALFVVGGENYITVLAVAAAACGRFAVTIWPATFGTVTCAGAGLAQAVQHHYTAGNTAVVLALPPMAAFFAYTAGKRGETVATLRQTRAELARVAVAEERLRIARDLHDLLGHSLSLITLKAELSRRLIGTDTERAGQEIVELEAVARQSLSDVRAAVAGYRQPDLAAELAAARQLLAAAGVRTRIDTPELAGLPGDVDAVLAWTIREGVTNVVRHAAAATVVITVTRDAGTVVADITDDGAGCPGGGGPAASEAGGSGLDGLAERVRGLGGDLVAGPVQPRGFRLQVSIPPAPLSQPDRCGAPA